MTTIGTLACSSSGVAAIASGREIEAGEILHAFLDHQFLRQRLGLRRIGLRHVAVDDLDGVVADLGAVHRHPGIDARLEVLALQRKRAGERADHADLDRIGKGRAIQRDSRKGSQYEAFHISLPDDCSAVRRLEVDYSISGRSEITRLGTQACQNNELWVAAAACQRLNFCQAANIQGGNLPRERILPANSSGDPHARLPQRKPSMAESAIPASRPRLSVPAREPAPGACRQAAWR